MKKLLLLTVLLFSKTIFSQNGWNAYLNGPSGPFLTGPTTALAIDKYGNKYLGFTSSLANSPAAFAKYNVAGGFWTYFNQANTPILPSNRVNTLAADTAGNVWIGTISGLVKYDGTTFSVFTNIEFY